MMFVLTHIIEFVVGLLCLAAVASTVSGLANCPPGCRCDDNTLVVQCGEGQLDVLPIALNPSIQRLVIRSNRIKTIDSSIQFYADLTFLDLSSNHLMTIPQRTFAYQKKLQELHLNHNKIGQISNKTFIGLSSVTVLNLRGNLISELHQGTFAPLLKIEELNLGVNRIGYIDPRAFEGLTQLRILYLDDNALTSVPDPVIFQSIPRLAELFLGVNTLLTIPSGTFQDLKGLTHLNLKGAGLKNISHDSFRGLEELRSLELSDNRLPRIPTVGLSNLARLEELSIGQNDFEIIMEGAFVGLKQLKRLDISAALRLKRVMNGAFGTNTNLEYLNLSSNRMLAEVQEGALSGLPHLKQVVLKANALTTLAEGLFPWKDLQLLDLSENPIACDCRVMWLRNLLLAKNGSGDAVAEVLCEYPERLRGEELKNLNPTLMGCTHTDPRKQALIGALLVGSAATITALALIIYRCRRKIREYLKGGIWGGAALGRKEREYQKTFCDEDYMTRLQHHPCSLGIHSTFPNTYTPHHPAASAQYGMCGMSIGEVAVEQGQKNCFQQLQVPSAATLYSDKKTFKPHMGTLGARSTCGAIDDSSSFVLHMKTNGTAGNGAGIGISAADNAQKLNHYTKPQFLTSTATVGDSCYSYADVPIMRAISNTDQRQQLRLTQDYFTQQRQPQHLKQQQQLLHYGSATLQQQQRKPQRSNIIDSDERRDSQQLQDVIMDPNYIYSNAHYSLPLEPTMERTKTPTPPPLPPALPMRNGGMHHGTHGRRSFNANSLGHMHAKMNGGGGGSNNNTGSSTASSSHNNNKNNNHNHSNSNNNNNSTSSGGSSSSTTTTNNNNHNNNSSSSTHNTLRNYH